MEKMENKKGTSIHLAVVAGFFATTGSLFGKLAGSVGVESMTEILLKLLLFGVMIIFNTTGCTFFVRSLQGCGSSLPATVVSSATNYFLSALVGFLVFGETTGLLWWSGTSLVLLGLILICYSSADQDIKKTDKNKTE